MKKTALILCLALCLCAMAACAASQSAPTAAPAPTLESQPTADVADDSGTDLYLPGDSGYVDDSATDVPAQPDDFTALTAEQCVADAWPTPGVLPQITLDCPGAVGINEQIQEKFVPIADDPMNQGLTYAVSKGTDRVLSILMIESGPNDCAFYTPYNLDLATGQALSGAELLGLLDVDEEDLANLEQAVLGQEFTHQFGLAEDQTDPDFYNEQYARTTAPENADTERVWLGDDGQLLFVGRVYPLAGAECYEYILGSTLTFG